LELSLDKFPQKFITFREFVIIRQILTLLKNGTFIGKSWAVIFFVKSIILYSPAKYLSVLKYIVKEFRATLKK
jgi:hypothetical protein